MDYLDFLIRIHSIGNDRFGVSVLGAPAGGDGSAIFLSLELSGLWPWNWSTAFSRDLSPLVETKVKAATPEESGSRLYRVVFRDRIGRLFEESVRKALDQEEGIRLKIFLDPEDPEVRYLQGLPWELLWTEDWSYLALRPWVSIVRSLPVSLPTNEPELPEHFHVLVTSAEPKGTRELDLEKEIHSIEAASRKGGFNVTPCRARFVELGRALDNWGPFHSFHFLGHGDFKENSGEGVLLFEDATGAKDEVDGASLAESSEITGLCSWPFSIPVGSAGIFNRLRSPLRKRCVGSGTFGISGRPGDASPVSDGAAIAFSQAL